MLACVISNLVLFITCVRTAALAGSTLRASKRPRGVHSFNKAARTNGDRGCHTRKPVMKNRVRARMVCVRPECGLRKRNARHCDNIRATTLTTTPLACRRTQAHIIKCCGNAINTKSANNSSFHTQYHIDNFSQTCLIYTLGAHREHGQSRFI